MFLLNMFSLNMFTKGETMQKRIALLIGLIFSFTVLAASQGGKPSPAASATCDLGGGKTIKTDYSSPRLRGRKMIGEHDPYGEVWRTGANPATTLITATTLKIGTLEVPAGTYTIYTLPNADQWLLIVNKQTGQWGTEYSEAKDLGRTPMQHKTLPAPQENMTISFEHTS